MSSQLIDTCTVVVTNCTTRKRQGHPFLQLPATRRPHSVDELADRWLTHLRRSKKRIQAGELYLGRSIVEAKTVAQLLGGALYFASAGVGLVRHTDSVPFYDLTVADGEGSIAPTLDALGATSGDWWSALNAARGQHQPLASLIAMPQVRAGYIALPASYIALVGNDLAALGGASRGKLRIFTSKAGSRQIPTDLQRYVMPYDERLESLPDFAGTRTEFPQRAMRHFIQILHGNQLSLPDAIDAVTRSLAPLREPSMPVRVRRTDIEIEALIRKNWTVHEGNSARLLRFLRDNALVACEQSRFRDIWHNVKTDFQSQGVEG
jgi:hypothetical protein